MSGRLRFAPVLLAAVTLVACTGTGGGPTPAPTVSPTPSPTADPVPVIGSPEEAGALVIASDQRFTGITRQDPDLIGQGSWWQAEAAAGGYRVHVQIGWGDCPAGCINRHDWIFSVTPQGRITLVEDSGDPLPGS